MTPAPVYVLVRCDECHATAETTVSTRLCTDDDDNSVTGVELWPDTPGGWWPAHGRLLCAKCRP